LLAERTKRAKFGDVHVQWCFLGGEIWLLAVNANESEQRRAEVPLLLRGGAKVLEAKSALTGKVYKVRGGKVALDLSPLGVEVISAVAD